VPNARTIFRDAASRGLLTPTESPRKRDSSVKRAVTEGGIWMFANGAFFFL
jgi:hypothetical protein